MKWQSYVSKSDSGLDVDPESANFANRMKAEVKPERKSNRFIGKIENQGGPVFVVTGGLHGNEPAGILAIERVFNYIREEGLQLSGSFIGVKGNIAAVSKNVRFINSDLNRIWFDEHNISRQPNQSEDLDRKEILKILQQQAEKTNRLYVMDLHTTSASSSPFFILGDTIRNRKFTANLPVPKVLGIEEQIDGTMSAFLNERGVVAINFEAGSHKDPKSIDRHEAAIWISLVNAGCLTEDQVPDFSAKKKLLRRASHGLPKVFESVFRYGITKDEYYFMRAGFYNFKRVRKGEHLAFSNGSPIFAPKKGRIFMPLYQEQGDDGFFIIRDVSPFWLMLSRQLRKLNTENWIGMLPGIEVVSEDKNLIKVDKSIARYYPLKVFHLLGYRKFREQGDLLYVSRRKYDFEPPEKLEL